MFDRSRLGDGLPAVHYYLYFFQYSDVKFNKLSGAYHQNLLNLPNLSGDSRMQFPSSYWLIHFSDLHGTLFKGIYLLLSIEFCCENWGDGSDNRKKVIKLKRENGIHFLSSKIILQTRKHLC
jgi:hypothetical protein